MGTGSLPYFLLAAALRLILSLELLHLWICLPAGMPRRLGAGAQGGETVIFFFFYIQRVYLAQKISSTHTATVERNLPEPAEHVQLLPLLYACLGDHFYFAPPHQHLRKQRKLAEECAAEEVHKFHMGGKFKCGQSDPWQAVVETSQWCHLPLSNIISLAGLMLRTRDDASGKQTHANRGVRILIDPPDQNQDNNTELQHSLKSPSLFVNARVLRYGSWNKISFKFINLDETTKRFTIKKTCVLLL